MLKTTHESIGIVDVGSGNIFSLSRALERLGYVPIRCSAPDQLSSCGSVLLPGVGSFSQVMDRLNKTGFAEVIIRDARVGKPILGICLGAQLFFNHGSEGSGRAGLGIIEGGVKPLNQLVIDARTPHVGWSQIDYLSDRQGGGIRNVKETPAYYFNHNYFIDTPRENILALVSYGGSQFASIVKSSNVLGVQFHPEKSSYQGLSMLGKLLENLH